MRILYVVLAAFCGYRVTKHALCSATADGLRYSAVSSTVALAVALAHRDHRRSMCGIAIVYRRILGKGREGCSRACDEHAG